MPCANNTLNYHSFYYFLDTWIAANHNTNRDCADVVLAMVVRMQGYWHDVLTLNPIDVTEWAKKETEDLSLTLGILRCRCPLCGYWTWHISRKTLAKLSANLVLDKAQTRLYWNDRVLCSIVIIDDDTKT